jgi:uncharacterized protein (UPF0332 family)
VTDDGRKASAAEELGRAREELDAAEHLLRVGLARVALTRAYFAVFHAVRAALYVEGLEPRTHRGALQLFNKHLVKSGRFEPASSRLQKFREEADYGEAFVIDAAGAREELDAARGFVARVGSALGPPPS